MRLEVIALPLVRLALTGVTPGPDPDTILTQLYDPNQANGKMTFYSNDMLNSLILQGRATVNQDDRTKIYSQAQQIIMTDLPAWPINERPMAAVPATAVRRFSSSASPCAAKAPASSWRT